MIAVPIGTQSENFPLPVDEGLRMRARCGRRLTQSRHPFYLSVEEIFVALRLLRRPFSMPPKSRAWTEHFFATRLAPIAINRERLRTPEQCKRVGFLT